MHASALILVAIGLFAAGYLFYGRYLAAKFNLDPVRKTPAAEINDGRDYVPTRIPVLLGHHFASIAGAAPIIGPVIAAVFGWVPVALWILFGSIFMGGAHDISALVASVRHRGSSIGEVIETHIGKSGKKLFLTFAWFLIVLVIAAFIDAVTSVFIQTPATATSSGLFILLAVLFGLAVYRMHAPLWISSIIGVGLLTGCIILGLRLPVMLPAFIWKMILFGYIFIAAVVPVWILLQPRDYLNAFLLYMLLVAGVTGILAADPVIQAPAFTAFNIPKLGTLFPILFVTVACGAISGFHALVSSGTTSKQLARETDARPVAYGSMLIEGLLSIIALITAATLLTGRYSDMLAKGGAIGVFSAGIGRFVTRIGIPEAAGKTFAALAISAFAMTTLDTATRLGRFMFQEFFESAGRLRFLYQNRYFATFVTIAAAALLTLTGTQTTIWPLFGAANQLLASLVLLAISVWLAGQGQKNGFVLYPMFFMFCVTLTALGFMVYRNAAVRNFPLLILSVLLLAVAVVLILEAVRSLKSKKRPA